MSDELRKLLWPFETEEEIKKHWELFNNSRNEA